MIEIKVDLKDHFYPVLVGAGCRRDVAQHLPSSAKKAAIVTQSNIGWELDLDGRTSTDATTCDTKIFHIPDGESAKSISTIEQLCRDFANWGLTRADVVIGLGGGVVTDVAGFAASVYHRGIPVIQVATSLLGQVDAAIGGKTGVNLPEGKNLVGTFWQPTAVFCDTETLSTLPERQLRCGRGEIAKYHFVGGDDLADLPLDEQIARCVEIKAEIVSQDEREQGRRALLNYGHTLAHALEAAGGYSLSHGEAVGVGLVYAAEVAALLGRIGAERVAEHREVVSGFGLAAGLGAELPTDGPNDAATNEELLAFFKRDKKATSGLTMVLDGADGLEVVPGLAPDVLLEAMDRIR